MTTIINFDQNDGVMKVIARADGIRLTGTATGACETTGGPEWRETLGRLADEANADLERQIEAEKTRKAEGDPEKAWAARLKSVDVPRRLVDAAEAAIQSICGDEIAMQRILTGQVGWRFDKGGRIWRLYVDEAAMLTISEIDEMLRTALAERAAA